MNKESESLLHLLKKFNHLLETTDDSDESFREFLNYIKLLLRTKYKKLTIPTVELISIIRARKPIVFQNLRKLGERDVNISILVGSTIPQEKAEERITILMEKLK